MIQALLEALATFGPMVFLMLTPILIPLAVETVGYITDRRKLLTGTRDASVESKPTALASRDRELTQAQLTKAA